MTTDPGVSGAPRFDVVLRGYDRRQVDEHVARLQRAVARMRADLELARSQPLPVVSSPSGGPPGQAPPGARPRPTPRPRPGGGPMPHGESPDMIGNFTDRMQSILQAAEEEAAEIRKKARVAARAEEDKVRAQLADLVRQRDALVAELTRMRGQLEGMLAAPTARITLPPRDGAPPAGRPRDTAAPGSSQQPPASSASAPAAPPSAGAPRGAAAPSGGQAARSGDGPGSHGPRPGAPAADGAQGGSARPAQGAPARSPSGSSGGAPGGSARADILQTLPPPSKIVPPGDPTGAVPHVAGDPRAGDRSSASSSGKPAAHRLPSGGYQAVGAAAGEQSGSMRPTTEPEPEPSELFRPPAGGREDEPRTSAVPHAARSGPAPAAERTTVVPTVRPADKSGPSAGSDKSARKPVPPDSTVKVNSVRPPSGSDAGRPAPPPGPGQGRSEQKNAPSDEVNDGRRGERGPGVGGGSDRSGRSASPSRSG
ncbi:hypothetical protein ACQPZA_02115 [Pseudonocardia xinjiangensis]|uniref:DivIVA domain-containing protein n=1 Tax=Pseudonocardia xinjiangensis TaxID=75289 RepID=UPI003D8F781F